MDTVQEIEKLDHAIHKMQMRIVYNERRDNELHPAQFQLIRLLETVDKISQTELARKAGVSNASVGTSMRRLEKIDLVRRTPDKGDRRVVYVALTPKGREYARSAKKYIMKLGEVKYDGFTRQELDCMKSLLARVYDNYVRYYEKLEETTCEDDCQIP